MAGSKGGILNQPRGAAGSRGQVLIIFVFAIIGLIAITGLAIDGGNIYSDRRHAQNAADTASLAAAVIKINQEKGGAGGCTDITSPTVCGALVKNAAMNMASLNGYASNITDSTVEVHIPPTTGPYADCVTYTDCHDYIEVIIRTNVNTWFARVLGIVQLHNNVEAVARAKYAPKSSYFGGSSLVELKATSGSCGGDFQLGGNGTVTLNGGGIFVNSDNDTCAFKQVSCTASLVLTGGASFEGVGGSKTSCTPPPPTMTQVTDQYAFPPAPPLLSAAPSACGVTPPPSTKTGGVTIYHPGYYHSLPTGSKAKLAAGVYCVDDVKTTNSDNLDGTAGVFIYIKPNGAFSFDGGTVKLAAPASDQPYAGYLIYADSTFTGSHPNCKINGTASDTFTGLIYAPNCDIVINGGSSPTGLYAQIVGYTMNLSGSSDIYFNFDPDKVPAIPEVNETGLYH
jgi:putative Flp pilus-assembly TadE/G-like protein